MYVWVFVALAAFLALVAQTVSGASLALVATAVSAACALAALVGVAVLGAGVGGIVANPAGFGRDEGVWVGVGVGEVEKSVEKVEIYLCVRRVVRILAMFGAIFVAKFV